MSCVPVLVNIEHALHLDNLWWRKFTGYLFDLETYEGLDEQSMMILIKVEEFAWYNNKTDVLDKDLEDSVAKIKKIYFEKD